MVPSCGFLLLMARWDLLVGGGGEGRVFWVVAIRWGLLVGLPGGGGGVICVGTSIVAYSMLLYYYNLHLIFDVTEIRMNKLNFLIEFFVFCIFLNANHKFYCT